MAQLDPAVVRWLHARNAPVSPANYNSAAELLRNQPDQGDILNVAEPSYASKSYDGGLDMGPDVPQASPPKPKSKPKAGGQQDAADTGKPPSSAQGGVTPDKGSAPGNAASGGAGPAGNAERTAGDLVSSNADAGGGHDASAAAGGGGAVGGLSIAALLGAMFKNSGGSSPAARVEPTGPSGGGAVPSASGVPSSDVAAGGGRAMTPFVHEGEVMPPSANVANDVAGMLNRPTIDAASTGPGVTGPQSAGLLSNNNAGAPSVEPGAVPRVPMSYNPDNIPNGMPNAPGSPQPGQPEPGSDLTALKKELFAAQQKYGPRSQQAAKVVAELQRLFATLRR